MFRLSLVGDFFRSEKAPYVVTLFVAALTWTMLRTSDRLVNTPFIEYRIDPVRIDNKLDGVEIRFRNITPSSSFECFLVTVASSSPDKLRFGDPTVQRHFLRGTVAAALTVTRAKPDEWEIQATDLLPGADIALQVPVIGKDEPRIMVRQCLEDEPGIKSEDREGSKKKTSPRPGIPTLLHRSLTTWFVEFELLILWAALGVWFTAMAGVILVKKPAPPRSTLQKPFKETNDEQGTID